MSQTAQTTHCDFLLVLVSVVAILCICQITPAQCAKFDKKLQKLINEDDLLTMPQQPIAPTSQHIPQQLLGKPAPAAVAASTKHEHYNLYHSELKRLSYETIHRILRDENEPNYRKEVSELRYYQKRSLQPTAHTVVRRSADVTQNASTLSLSGFNLRNFSATANYTTLQQLDLSKNQLSAVNLSSCHALEQLDLSDNALVALPLLPAAASVNLAMLNLNNNHMQSLQAPALAQLHALHLSGNQFSNLASLNLSQLNALESLDLSCNRISNLETAFFPERMHNLKHLNLANNALSSIYRATFYNLLSLNTLVLRHNNIREIDYETFLALPNLQFLDLSHNQLQAESIRALQGIPDLVSLSIAYNPAVGAAMQEFVASWSLKELDASGTGLCQIPAALAQSVRTLKLAHNWLKIINCGDLDSYPLLQYLDLSYSRIEDIEDDALGRLEILHTLFLDHNELRKVPVSLPSTLENLFLNDNKIMDIHVTTFQALRNLQILDLSGNRLLLYLPALQLPKLLTLNLESAGITGVSQAIVHTLPSLRDLLLEDNPIKCSDLLGIAEWASPCRERVTVSGTSADNNADDGAVAIDAKAQQQNADIGQQPEQLHNMWVAQTKSNAPTATTTKASAKIDLKQKFLQEHNFFANFKSNCGKTRQMLTQITEAEPNCALEWQEETTITTIASAGKEETAAMPVQAKQDKPEVISQFVLSGDKTKVLKKYAQATAANAGTNMTATATTPNNYSGSLAGKSNVVGRTSQMLVRTTHTLHKFQQKPMRTTYFTKRIPALATTTPSTKPTIATTNEANNNEKIPTTAAHAVADAFLGIASIKAQQIAFPERMPKMTIMPTVATAQTMTTAAADVTTKMLPTTATTSTNAYAPHAQPLLAQHATATLNQNLGHSEQLKKKLATKPSIANYNAAAIEVQQPILTSNKIHNNSNSSSGSGSYRGSSSVDNKSLNDPKKQVSLKQTYAMPKHVMRKISEKATQQQVGIDHSISGQQQAIELPAALTSGTRSNNNAEHSLASVTKRPDVLPTTAEEMTTTLPHIQQHKHEPLQLHIKDRHLIGTPLLMHKGENILVESAQLRPLPTIASPSLTPTQQRTASLALGQPTITTTHDNSLQQNVDANTQQADAMFEIPAPHGRHGMLDNAKANAMYMPEHAKKQDVQKKWPSLTMKKMTITTKHAAALPVSVPAPLAKNNAANENEAWPDNKHSLNFKEPLPKQHATTAPTAVKHHNTVNTAIAANQHELSTFAEHQQHAESLIKEPTASETKTAQWLDMRKAQTNGHPGIVLLLSLSLFVVLLIGLMHVYRCDMPWRRHLPPQRPHHQRQCSDDDAHSFLSYQKCHHSARLEQPYNSPLHSLHVRELQKSNSLNAQKQRLTLTAAQYPAAQLLLNTAGASASASGDASGGTSASVNGSDSCSSASSTGSSTSSHSSGLNGAHALTPPDNDAYFIEMSTTSAHLHHDLHCDLLPMELLHMSTAHARAMPDVYSSAIQTTPVSYQYNALATNVDVATTTLNHNGSLGDNLSPTTRKLSIW